jgi:hypothetical protein
MCCDELRDLRKYLASYTGIQMFQSQMLEIFFILFIGAARSVELVRLLGD